MGGTWGIDMTPGWLLLRVLGPIGVICGRFREALVYTEFPSASESDMTGKQLGNQHGAHERW